MGRALGSTQAWVQYPTMASLRHILMERNGDYFLIYIDY